MNFHNLVKVSITKLFLSFYFLFARTKKVARHRMATINQLVKEIALKQSESQKRWLFTRSFNTLKNRPSFSISFQTRCVHQSHNKTPKKPNSAIRKIARVRLTNGISHCLHSRRWSQSPRAFSCTLRGGRVKTLDFDTQSFEASSMLVVLRVARTSRSSYGAKKPKDNK